VSRALNGHDDVAESTKARIREAARALDYHPNAVARSLQNNRTNALGLVISSIFHRTYDPFWLEFIGGMASVCAQNSLDLSLSVDGGPAEATPTFQRWVRSRRVDGLVVCDVRTTDARLAYLAKHRVPFVAFGRTIAGHDYPYIDVDGAVGVTQALAHLTQLGHQHIAYLGLDPDFGFSHFRLIGYKEGLARAGLRYNPALVYEGLTEASVGAAAARLLALPHRPTAVVAAADFVALAVLRIARGAGLAVPGDLSLVVFDDSLPVQQAEPPLTAISQPNKRLGEEAAALLIDRIANPEGRVAQRLIVPGLVTRQSTAPPPTPAEERRMAPDGEYIRSE
jgi:LacI family transcriptional regulator